MYRVLRNRALIEQNIKKQKFTRFTVQRFDPIFLELLQATIVIDHLVVYASNNKGILQESSIIQIKNFSF